MSTAQSIVAGRSATEKLARNRLSHQAQTVFRSVGVELVQALTATIALANTRHYWEHGRFRILKLQAKMSKQNDTGQLSEKLPYRSPQLTVLGTITLTTQANQKPTPYVYGGGMSGMYGNNNPTS
jgi:hypothetical protein